MESIDCIFCGEIGCNDTIVIEENGYTARQCSQCHLIYLSPRPTAREIAELYETDQSWLSAQAHIRGPSQKRLYAKHNLKLIRKHVRKGTLLEIGPGAGYFLDESRKSGFIPFGIELNPIQATHIRNTLAITCEEKPLSPTSFNGRKFDIIYHCDVLSHFYDPIAEFTKFHNALELGGFLIFETGNLGDVKRKYDTLEITFQFPDHLFFFSENNLKELLRRTGFELVTIYHYSILLQMIFQRPFLGFIGNMKKQKNDSKRLKLIRTPEERKGLAWVIAQRLWSRVNYFLRYQVGSLSILIKADQPQTLLVVAHKKS